MPVIRRDAQLGKTRTDSRPRLEPCVPPFPVLTQPGHLLAGLPHPCRRLTACPTSNPYGYPGDSQPSWSSHQSNQLTGLLTIWYP